MNLIIVRLNGGLGNQLFQYGAGLALSRHLNLPLRLDDFWFRSKGGRSFLLDRFQIDAPLATEDEVFAVVKYRRSLSQKLVHGARMIWKGLSGSEDEDSIAPEALLKEPESGLLSGFFDDRAKAYLDGYWQSTRYFASCEEELRSSLRLRKEASGSNAHHLKRLSEVDAVSLHVRRGDYASEEGNRAIYGLRSVEYYHRALAMMEERHGRLPCYVFSDGPDWVRDNLQLPEGSILVDWNGDEAPQEDLRLMAGCRHHILANSSFSWWGAWLAFREGQSVIAPSPWYRTTFEVREGFFPEHWTILEDD